VSLPADSHVHTEWSWDAQHGSMQRSCARAVELGLPSVAFTEHVDHTVWTVDSEALSRLPADHPVAVFSDAAGHVHAPPFDADGYLDAVDRCRQRFPHLRILTGLELGEPHWHPRQVAGVLAAGTFDRVLGSLHGLSYGDGFQEPTELFADRDPDRVLRDYLLETARLVGDSDMFSVLAHIDYPVRSWPADRPFDPASYEAEFRHGLRATARSGKALEISTVVPLAATVVRWWHEEGGTAVSFGSDAHEPDRVADGFAAAAALAEANGFRAAADPLALWTRS
jgi:histidinol-phosphatase (PHP family)